METFFINFWHNFWHDELAFKRWMRGGLNACAAILVQVVADPMWSTWSGKQWLIKMLPSVVAFAAGSVTATRKDSQ
jgi:hypothetical protein